MDYENLTPQYRIEEYLEAIVEGWAEATQYPYPDYPSWRIEEFLDAFITYIWEDGGHPRHPCPNPVWRLEECLRAIYDVMTGAATPWPFPLPTTNRIEEYLAAIHAYLADGTELPVPEPVWRIEQWLAYVLDAVKQGGGVETTVSGTLVHITNALAKAALSVLASIEPIQDLHGYANPWPGGGGKNKYNPDEAQNNKWVNSTTGEIENANGYWVTGYIPVKSGDVVKTTDTKGSTRNSWFNSDKSTSQYVAYSGGGNGITAPYDGFFVATIGSSKIDFGGDFVVTINDSDLTYAPYSNICPISGRTGLSVYRTGKNLCVPDLTNGQIGSNGGYSANTGRVTNTVLINGLYLSNTYLPAGTYTLSIADLTQCTVITKDSSGNTIDNFATAWHNLPYTFTMTAAGYVLFTGRKSAGDLNPDDYKAQIESGSVTAYEPYNGNTYAFDWTSDACTVYGGTLDVVSGVLTDKMGNITVDDFTSFVSGTSRGGLHWVEATVSVTANAEAISSMLEWKSTRPAWDSTTECFATENGRVRVYTSASSLSDFKTRFADLTVVYELATPLTYQLTAQEVQMLLGENYVWSSSGDTVSVTYYAEGNANPLQSLNILLGGRYSNPKTADDVSDKEALEIILGGNK